MADEGQEKTHEASEKKKRDAAEKGQMVKSKEINSALILLTGAASLTYANGQLAASVLGISRWALDVSGPQIMSMEDALELLHICMRAIAAALSVPLGLLVLAALFAGFAQTRFQLATKAMEPKWERLNPFEGIKNQYLSWSPLVELAKGLTKLGTLGAVTWFSIRGQLHTLPGMAMTEPGAFLQIMVDLGWRLVLSAMPLIILIAVLDYAYNHWKHSDDLKMTQQEFKQENKEMSGDPHQRQARRQRARQIAMGNAVRLVKQADVVVTNPTHYAVALRYRADESSAPVILAMGIDHIALKIRQEARRHDVQIIENRPLARALHARGKAGQPIPPEFFSAVAKVLAAVYRRRARRRV